jgi:hypothetical protein
MAPMSDHDDPVARGYRDDQYAHELTRQDALREVLAVMADDRVRAVYVRRRVRAAVGGWLLAGSAAMAISAFHWSAYATRVLLAAWVAAPAVALVAWIMARARATTALRSAGERAMRGDALTGDGATATRARVSAAFTEAGVHDGRAEGLVLAGVSLMAPLTLHLAYATITQHTSYVLHYDNFSEWMRTSLVIVGHCHLVLAFMGWRYTWRLAVTDPGRSGVLAGFKAVGVASLVAVLPGALLLGVPIALVAVTGSAFAPLAWWWATQRMRSDRATLDDVVHAARASAATNAPA